MTDWTTGSGRQPLDLRVYAVTDPKCNQQWQRSNAAAVELAVAGGVTLVQLREKLADGGDYVQQAREVIAVARPRGVRGPGPCMQTNAVTPHLGLQPSLLHEHAQHASPCLRLQPFCLGQQLARGVSHGAAMRAVWLCFVCGTSVLVKACSLAGPWGQEEGQNGRILWHARLSVMSWSNKHAPRYMQQACNVSAEGSFQGFAWIRVCMAVC